LFELLGIQREMGKSVRFASVRTTPTRRDSNGWRVSTDRVGGQEGRSCLPSSAATAQQRYNRDYGQSNEGRTLVIEAPRGLATLSTDVRSCLEKRMSVLEDVAEGEENTKNGGARRCSGVNENAHGA